MKRILFLSALLLAVFSCNRSRTQFYEDDLVLPLGAGSADSLHLSVSLEYLSAGLSPEAADAINGSIAAQAFDLEDLSGSIEECGILYRENLIDLYLSENAGGEGLCTWEDQIDGSFLADWKRNKVYVLTYYSFRGGAHGIMTQTCLVFDPKTGAQLSEDDLFREGYRGPLAKLLQENLARSLAEEGSWPDMLFTDQVVPNGNFLPDAQGVTWFYQPYEAGPYALGILAAGATWAELKPYLK